MAEPRARATAGFTLAEMLAALGILLVGVVALLGALSTSVAERRTTDARLAAAAACDGIVQRLRLEATRRVADGVSDLDVELAMPEDRAVPGFDGMTWSATAAVDEDRPDVWLLRIEVRWLEEGDDVAEVFYRVLPRSLPLGERVRRFRDEIDRSSAR